MKVNKKSVVDISSVKLVGENSLLVKNTGLKLEDWTKSYTNMCFPHSGLSNLKTQNFAQKLFNPIVWNMPAF